MLTKEAYERIAPGASSVEEVLGILKRIYPKEKKIGLGVVLEFQRT